MRIASLGPKTKRRLESTWETILFVVVAYLSQYIASGKNLLFDQLFLSVVFASSLILNIIARHYRKVRGSGNRWVIFSNRSVLWFFAVFVGAISDGLPTLISLIFQYPELVGVVVLFLGLVFAIIDLSKETEEFVKVQPKPTG